MTAKTIRSESEDEPLESLVEIVPAKLESLRLALIKAETIDEIKRIRDGAEGLRRTLREAKLALGIQNEAATIRIRSEYRIGTILQDLRKQRAGAKKKGQNIKCPTLEELGVSQSQSSRWQTIALLPPNEFEKHLVETSAAGEELTTARVERAARKYQKALRRPKFDSLIKPSDNWNFSSVRYPRINSNSSGHGYIPGDIYANCFWYYVKPETLVVDPMACTGMAKVVYDDRSTWMGEHSFDFELRLFDLSPQSPYVIQHNLLDGFPVDNPDYIVMDVPYYGMAKDQYSDHPDDLANMNLEDWLKAMDKIARHCAAVQKPGTLCTIISPNYRDIVTRQIILITDRIRQMWESCGYVLYDKAYSSRRIQRSQTPRMAMLNNTAKTNQVLLTDMTEVITFKRL